VRRLFLGCGLLIFAQTAYALSAEPSLPVQMIWNGPEICNGANATLEEIRRLVGNRQRVARSKRIGVVVVARPGENGKWSIRVTTASGEFSGERTLEAESCDEARRAVALLVALMIDPDARESATQLLLDVAAPNQHQSPVEPDVNARKGSPTFAAPLNGTGTTDAVAARPRLFTSVELVADRGTLPELGLGTRLMVGVNVLDWSFGVRGDVWAGRSADYAHPAGAGVKFNLYVAELLACVAAIRIEPTALLLCAGPELQVFRASSYGVSAPGTATSLSVAAFGEAALRYGITRRVAVRLALEGVVPFARPEFAVRGLGGVFQPWAFAARLALGPEVEF
jgi:hypothetical protein